ncbi:hypothetical protein [Streptomyces sp. NPDC056308]|uniref:hypothetical protein n=1 Tax=Streptomyces sp. NPDC056308 TaxID=3345780 RepID=UPI0035E109F1
MSTWEERLADASTCEPRRPFDVAAGLRRLARDAGYLQPPATERPASTAARRRLKAVTVWGVTQAGAAAHMKDLTDIIDTPDTTFKGWTDLDIDGVHVFACSLHLANHPESARFWWQFAAGAGHGAAAYCLHLQHLIRGEMRDAAYWWNQVGDIVADSGGTDLNASELTNLIEMLELFAGYSARTGAHRALPIGGLKAEVDRLADDLHGDGLLCRPDRRLADRLRELTASDHPTAKGSPPLGRAPLAVPTERNRPVLTTPPSDRPSRPLRGWFRRQRRVAAGHFVRGLAYGTGLTAAGLLGYWLQLLL